ncbi:apolipoprotein N-acyltransferase [Marivita sp. GX14005]|uniref:apolipoprotein N-acyltransferase n=1 Tax=Marivita sp. GX14005 TaxID=2942276 RepID=UPI0020198178|nr:apolipoprotein N-acyltransferase [Marivita sp. GX14005]MCL3882199.1 apolipoprotein N-acyltransferase [Marivita sp. GX14005]
MRGAAALALGAVFALGQPPFDLWWAAILALVALFAVLRDTGAKAAGWSGWLFGTGYFAISLHWILQPFQVDAAATGWMAPFALVGLSAGLALFWAAGIWAGRRLAPGPFGIGICWAAAELARAYLFTGFPWGLVGYLWAPTPVAQWHAVTGPHGLSLATLLLAGFAAMAARFGWRAWAAFGGIAAMWLGGLWLTPAGQTPQDGPIVRLVQPNAPQHQKWDPDYIPLFFNRQIDFTAAMPRPDLIVWPETSVPNLLKNADYALDIISEMAGGVPVVLGIQRENDGNYYNSLIVLNAAGEVGETYDKHHLVPFGEYMPFPELFARFDILGLAARAASGYSAGPGPDLIDLGPLGRALPLICYEAVFPQDVGAAPERPDVLVQITNDAWFGTYAGPQQHLAQARLRAIEQGLPFIRVANTGISAVIDPAGRIVGSLGLGRAGYLDVTVPQPAAPTVYSRTGDWPVIIALFGALAALIAVKRRAPH